MNQILRCDWLPERARSYLAHSGLPAASHKKNFPESHLINPLSTKFVRSRLLDIGLVLFLRVYGPRLRLGQYPSILTSHLVNQPIHLPFPRYLMPLFQNESMQNLSYEEEFDWHKNKRQKTFSNEWFCFDTEAKAT